MAKYLKNINSLDDLKSKYRDLLKKNHPDNGGEVEVMQEINAEYDALFAIWKSRKEATTGEKVTETAESTRRHFYTQFGWAGSRYDGKLTLKEIARIARAYVKEKYPTCKFSIRTKYASMCQELIASIKEFPAQMFKTADDLRAEGLWETETREDINGEPYEWTHYKKEVDEMHNKLRRNSLFTVDSWNDDELINAYSEAVKRSKFYAIKTDYFQSVIDDVNAFIKSYNYEDCDGMQDYFDVNFYFFGVGFEECEEVIKTARVTDTQEKTPATREAKETAEETEPEYIITADTDTRDNSPLWVVKFSDRVSRETYEKERDKMKSLGGYYSRFKKGFIFREDPTPLLYPETATEPTQETAPEEIPTAETESATEAQEAPTESANDAPTEEPQETTETAYGYTGTTSELFDEREIDLLYKGAQIIKGEDYYKHAYFTTAYIEGVRLVYSLTVYRDDSTPAPGHDAKYCGFITGGKYYESTTAAAEKLAEDINAALLQMIPTETTAEANAGSLETYEAERVQTYKTADYTNNAERLFVDGNAPELILYSSNGYSITTIIQYIQNPAEVVTEYATETAKNRGAEIYYKYIEYNRTRAALDAIKADKTHRAHTLRRIAEATAGDTAKTYKITLNNGLTVKAEAAAVKRVASWGYINAWNIASADRDKLNKDERGRAKEITAEEIKQITHGGRVVYRAA